MMAASRVRSARLDSDGPYLGTRDVASAFGAPSSGSPGIFHHSGELHPYQRRQPPAEWDRLASHPLPI